MPGVHALDWQAVLLSAQVALSATLLALPFGFFAAWLLVFSRLPGRVVLDGLINLPLVLPPVVVGYLLLLVLGRRTGIGAWLEAVGFPILFTWKAAVLASLVVGFPLLVRSIRTGMEGIDPRLLQAARVLGAPWYDSLFSIILPLSVRSILAGAGLMFARSLGEFGATVVVAGNIPGVTQTIPLAIYQYSGQPGREAAALTLCLLSIVLAFLVLAASERLTRRLDAGGRR